MKIEISKEWCLNAATREGDEEVGVGSLEQILYWAGHGDGRGGKVRRWDNAEYIRGYWDGYWNRFEESADP